MDKLIIEESPTARISYDWLMRLRWGALTGQTLLFVFLPRLLKVELSLAPLLCILAISITSNVALVAWRAQLQSPRVIQSVMLLDVLLLSGLLYYSGGASNPFSILYLIYVVIGSILLGSIWAWRLATLSTFMFGILFFWYKPITSLEHQSHSTLINTHLFGMLLSFVLTAFLLAYFQTRISVALQNKEAELTNLKLHAEKQSRLASLTTIAAGAAHELGTPLSTIAIAIEELQSQIKSESPLSSDIQLIAREVSRCRLILRRLNSQTGQVMGEMPERFAIDRFLQELRELFKERIEIGADSTSDTDAILFLPHSGLLQAVTALIQNAIDAMNGVGPATVSVLLTEEFVEICVTDSGVGMDESVLSRLGEPFFSTKMPGTGLGLGVFLTKLFADQLRGQLSFRSRIGQGTTAILQLPIMISHQ